MSSATGNYDVLIVGGGAIGLSLAWELAQYDVKVCLIDSGQLGRKASWAGAGMIPPGAARAHWDVATVVEQLEALSDELHAQWHERLLEQTGIDNEYCRCGSIQLALSAGDCESLEASVARLRQLGIAFDPIDAIALADIEPALAGGTDRVERAFHLPGEAQIRNPRHLQAIISACQRAGVELRPETELRGFKTSGDRINGAITSAGTLSAGQYCLTAGSWSGLLAKGLEVDLPVRPIRGQIALLNGPPNLLKRIVIVGPRYLVARRDGRVLVGSTQEDVGYVDENTPAGIDQLMQFAATVSPGIAQLPIEIQWSGLRPATADGLPYLGRLPHLENGWIATGHFRAGLQLSPATAVVMRSMILYEEPMIDVSDLRADR